MINLFGLPPTGFLIKYSSEGRKEGRKEVNVREVQTKEQGRQCTYYVILRRVHVTIVAVEKQ